MDEINMTEQILKLVQGVGELTSKVDNVERMLDGMRDIPQQIQGHSTRLDQIDLSLQRGNQRFIKIDDKFDKMDARMDKIEQAAGEKAKDTIAKICNYLLIAIVGAIVANIPTIINALSH